MCTHQCLVLSVNQLSAPFFWLFSPLIFRFVFLGSFDHFCFHSLARFLWRLLTFIYLLLYTFFIDPSSNYHANVCFPVCVHLLYGSENGDPDEERGVHAPIPVPSFSGERHLLDCLRPHQIRPLHHRKLLIISLCVVVRTTSLSALSTKSTWINTIANKSSLH